MRVLLDENLPHDLAEALVGLEVVTVQDLGWAGVKNGELLWRSPGFAPRGCVNPAVANGRVFWPSAASGMIFCWEPKEP